MKKAVVIIISLVAIVALGVALLGKNNPSSNASGGGDKGDAKVGSMAPDFSLPSTTGETITLSNYKGNTNVLIYFHEGNTCDPCMQQMPEIDKLRDQLLAMKVLPLYVALDKVDAMQPAAAKYNLTTPVLSYNDAQTEQDYNLLPYSMGMGRRAGHTFILVDMEGKIIWRKDYWPSVGMSVPGGRMFVDGSEIMQEVRTAMGS